MNHHTTPNPELIRQLVTEVVARIRSQQVSGIHDNNTSEPLEQNNQSTRMSIDDRVITLATIARLPKESKSVQIEAKAVVTPSAWEYAQDQGIQLVRAAKAQQNESQSPPLVVGQADCKDYSTQHYASIIHDLPYAQQLPTSGLRDVSLTLSTQTARSGARGILLCGRPNAAVVLLNRTTGVRAVTGHDPRSVQSAIEECAANIIVLNPKIFPRGTLRRICNEFASATFRTCPQELADVPTTPCSCTQSSPP